MEQIRIVHAHAEGEVGDVIVGGVAPPPGETLWEQRTWLQQDGRLHRFLLNEPRGGVFRHANLLVPPVHPEAQAGFIIMEPADLPAMSGSNTICVATVLLETGIVPMTEPETHLVLEAPGGLVRVIAHCRDGKAQSIRLTNLPAFARALDLTLEVEGLGTLTVDTAWGGDSFVMVDAAALGFRLTADEARDLAATGARITAAATEQLGFAHPVLDWTHISFRAFCGPLTPEEGALATTHAVAIRPGKIDRSPTGTAVSARMAVFRARNRMKAGDRLIARSLTGGRFTGRIEADTTVGQHPAVVPSVEGRAWITGRSTLTCDPSDPWPEGYRLSDTWPGA